MGSKSWSWGLLVLMPLLRALYAVLGGTLVWLAFPGVAWWRLVLAAVGVSLVITGGVRGGVDEADENRWQRPVRDGVKEALRDEWPLRVEIQNRG